MVKEIKRPITITADSIWRPIKMSANGTATIRGDYSYDMIKTKKQFTVNAGDLVMRKQSAKDGGFAIINDNAENMVGSGDLVIIDPNQFDKYMLWFILRSRPSSIYLDNKSVGVQGRNKIKDVIEFINLNLDVIDEIKDKYDWKNMYESVEAINSIKFTKRKWTDIVNYSIKSIFNNDRPTKKLSDVVIGKVRIGQSSTNKLDLTEHGEHLVIRSGNIKTNKIVIDDARYIDKADYESVPSGAKLVKGDVIYSVSGDSKAAVNYDFEGNVYSNSIASIRVDENIVLPEFISILLNSDYFIRNFKMDTTGVIPYFGITELNRLEIPIYTIEEQKNIVREAKKVIDLYSKFEEFSSFLQKI